MTITNGLATLAEFKLYVASRGETVSVAANDDAVIEDIIEAVSRYIEGTTGRWFHVDSADATRYYQPESSSYCTIDGVSSVTSVSVDFEGLQTTYTALDADDYNLLPYNASLDGVPYTAIELSAGSDAYFTTFPKSLKVVGKFGFATVPDNIKVDCLTIALKRYQDRIGQEASTATKEAVEEAEKDILRYRRIT
jgi:hypothetical protein